MSYAFKPVDRIDGRLKVMGKATYSHEVQDGGPPAYGFILEASIAKGTVAEIDASAAERCTGVLLVMTHKNAPKQAPWRPMTAPDRFARSTPQLADNRIEYYGQPVAFVVAQSFEQARSAARQIKVRYAGVGGEFELAPNLAKATKPADDPFQKTDSIVGEFEPAFAAAPVKFDATFTTPFHVHAQMEPHATLAYWKNSRVIIHCSAQLLESAQNAVAATLQIAPEQVRIVSRYIGGGFGGKLGIYSDVFLSAMAARALKRPVKTALTRQQMFHLTGHRSETIQRVRLGATTDGKLTSIGHETWSHSARFDNFSRALARRHERCTRHLIA